MIGDHMNLFDKIIYDLFLKENGSEKTEVETKETNSFKLLKDILA